MIELEIFYPSGNSVPLKARNLREAERKAEKALNGNASHVEVQHPEGGAEILTIEDFSNPWESNYPCGYDFHTDSPAYQDFMADAA